MLSALPDQLDVEYAAGVSTCASEGGDYTTCDADVLSPGEDSVVVSWAVAADATGAATWAAGSHANSSRWGPKMHSPAGLYYQ